MSANTHVDRLLTDHAIAYIRNNPGAARQALTQPVPVTRTSDLIYVWDRADFLRDDFRGTGYGDAAPIWRPGGATVRYQIQPEALAAQIVWQERDNADDPAQYERALVEGLMSKALYAEDRVFAASVMLDTSWASSNRLVGVSSSPTGLQFLSFAQSGSDPIGVIERGRDIARTQTGGGAVPNVLVVSADVDRTLRSHSQIQTKINAAISGNGILTGAARREQMAGIFGVDRYVVIDVARVTSVEGNATVTTTDLSSGQMCLMHAPSSPSLVSPAAVKLFELRGPAVTGVGAVRRWTDDRLRSDMIEAMIGIDARVTANVAGVHFASCLA